MELWEFSEHRDQGEICMQTPFYVTFLLLLFILLRHNFSEVITTRGTLVIHVARQWTYGVQTTDVDYSLNDDWTIPSGYTYLCCFDELLWDLF